MTKVTGDKIGVEIFEILTTTCGAHEQAEIGTFLAQMMRHVAAYKPGCSC